MKVLHITHLYPRPYDDLLGIAMHRQIKALEAQGCIQKVISPTAWAPFPIKYLSHKWKSYAQVPMRELVEGIEVYYPRYLVFPRALLFASSGVCMYWGIRKLIRRIEREFSFDLIHAHMTVPDGYAGMLISMEYERPLVISVQATDVDITAKRSKSCVAALQRVFAYASRVIAPSPRLAKTLLSQFDIEPVVIGYGFDPSEVFTGSSELLSKYRGRRVLLSVSRLIPTKGIDLNVCALKCLVDRYQNLLYLVVGDGPERPRLEQLVCDLNLTKYVRFVGHLPPKQVMEYMAHCELFTLPSWQETFGLVYIEAMAHAKPVIGVQGQGVDGIVIHGETGLLVKPRDVDSLVEALDFLLSHPEEAKAMGERARKVVLDNYTWEKNAEKTIEVYRDVLKG